jgi:hypothetical protein
LEGHAAAGRARPTIPDTSGGSAPSRATSAAMDSRGVYPPAKKSAPRAVARVVPAPRMEARYHVSVHRSRQSMKAGAVVGGEGSSGPALSPSGWPGCGGAAEVAAVDDPAPAPAVPLLSTKAAREEAAEAGPGPALEGAARAAVDTRHVACTSSDRFMSVTRAVNPRKNATSACFCQSVSR